jgi:hypothetical protein
VPPGRLNDRVAPPGRMKSDIDNRFRKGANDALVQRHGMQVSRQTILASLDSCQNAFKPFAHVFCKLINFGFSRQFKHGTGIHEFHPNDNLFRKDQFPSWHPATTQSRRYP